MADERFHDWNLRDHLNIAAEDASIAQKELEAYEHAQDANVAVMSMGGLSALLGGLMEQLPGVEGAGYVVKWGGALVAAAGVMSWDKRRQRFNASPFQNPDN